MNQTLDMEMLFDEYVLKEKPMHQIAKEQNVAVGTVFNYLKKYGISGRRHLTYGARKKISDANKGKAYRLGKKCSEDTKRKLSERKKGVYLKPSEYGGHKKHRSDGYVSIYCPDHPDCAKDGYVMEHILIMEAQIGRRLKEDEVVHHINKIRSDNRIENLRLMTSKEHLSMHMKERWNKKRGVMTYQ